MTKEFKISKWIVLPLINLVLCSIVLWFNIKVFKEDGFIYVPIIALLFGTSLFYCYYVNSKNSYVGGTSFILEVLLIMVLIGSSIFCLSIQRKMSLADESSKEGKEALKDIGKIKGRKNQAEALKHLKTSESKTEVFKAEERILFFLLMGELAVSALGAVSLVGLSRFTSPKETSTEVSKESIESSRVFPETSVRNSRVSYKSLPQVAKFETSSRDLKSEYLYNDSASDYFRVKRQASGVQVWNESRYLKHISHKKLEGLEPLTYDKIKAIL